MLLVIGCRLRGVGCRWWLVGWCLVCGVGTAIAVGVVGDDGNVAVAIDGDDAAVAVAVAACC